MTGKQFFTIITLFVYNMYTHVRPVRAVEPRVKNDGVERVTGIWGCERGRQGYCGLRSGAAIMNRPRTSPHPAATAARHFDSFARTCCCDGTQTTHPGTGPPLSHGAGFAHPIPDASYVNYNILSLLYCTTIERPSLRARENDLAVRVSSSFNKIIHSWPCPTRTTE